MDWTVYWFMLPVCVVIATAAMFSGIRAPILGAYFGHSSPGSGERAPGALLLRCMFAAIGVSFLLAFTIFVNLFG